MKRTMFMVVSGFGLALLAVPLSAHHSMSAAYDDAKPIFLSGTITKIDWSNPHVWIYIDTPPAPPAKSGRGSSIYPRGTWEVEFASRIELKRNGWTANSFKIGDEVNVEGSRARDGSKQAHGKTITLVGGYGRRDSPSPMPNLPTSSNKATPKWPDGHPRLGPEPGQAGYWVNATGNSLSESATIKMNSEGLLANVADVDKVAPFQPWAKALYLVRQKNRLKDDPMASCLPPGGPRQFQAPYGIRFLEEPARQRIFVMSHGGNRNWRNIDLDGRALPKLEDASATYFGYSVGKWEGDTLVIQSLGYVERFWMSNGGLPHTESARLTERISRPNFDTLRYEVTVDDPGAYTRPWTSSWTMRWVASDDADEYFCDDNNRDAN
jgi:hypothetical protein